jgi:hypothetical protein
LYTQRFDSGGSGANEINAILYFPPVGFSLFVWSLPPTSALFLPGLAARAAGHTATPAGAAAHNALTFELDPSVGVDQAAQYAVFRTRRGKTSMDTNTLLIIIILILLVGGGWFGRGRWF